MIFFIDIDFKSVIEKKYGFLYKHYYSYRFHMYKDIAVLFRNPLEPEIHILAKSSNNTISKNLLIALMCPLVVQLLKLFMCKVRTMISSINYLR